MQVESKVRETSVRCCHKACIAINVSSPQMGYSSQLAARLLKVAISHLPINRLSGFKQPSTISMQEGRSAADSMCPQQESTEIDSTVICKYPSLFLQSRCLNVIWNIICFLHRCIQYISGARKHVAVLI